MFRVISLLSGLLFGLGMTISGMADPANVIGFLDIAGNWNMSLAFVMGGALSVFMPMYFLVIKKNQQPLVSNEFCVSSKKNVDRKLIGGSALFGMGWGLAGICPGPVVSSLALGNTAFWLFFASMCAGFMLVMALEKSQQRKLALV